MGIIFIVLYVKLVTVPKYVVTLVKQSIFMLFAFSFICLFVGKNQQCIQCRYTKSNPTCRLPYFMLQRFFPQNLFYKWKCTNKQNHNVQDVTPWACNGGRSPVLQGKGKVRVGRLQTLCFQSSVSTFTFPIRSLFLLHTSRHAHIWSLAYTVLHVGLYNYVNTIVLKRHWPLFWTGESIQYQHGRHSTTK